MEPPPPPPCRTPRTGASTDWRWGLWFLLAYLAAALARLHPLAARFSTHFLGAPERDLFDEMWMQKAVLGTILEGHWFWTRAMDFPTGLDLAASHLSYLHILFTAPLPLSLPWPAWWNAVNLVALVLSALAAAWATNRICGGRVPAFLAGLALLGLPWVACEANAGHLNQLWMAPMFMATGYLHQALHDPRDRHAWWLLASWTALASQVYWIYGLALALVGAVLVLCHLPRLGRATLGRLALAVLVTVATMTPLAFRVYATEAVPAAYRNAGIYSRRNAIARAVENSLELGHLGARRGSGWSPLRTPAARWIPLGLALTGLVLLGLEWRLGTDGLPWLLAAGALTTLALGPHLLWQDRILVDAEGRPVAMPFLLLQDLWPLLYRWSLPLRTAPMAFLATYLGTVCLARRLARRSRLQAVLAWSLGGVAILLAGAGLSPRAEARIVLTPARVPDFCRFLAGQPEGAIVDLPLGYVENVWQLQIHHPHPKVQGLAMEPLLLNRNPFLQELASWNQQVLPAGLALRPRPANSEAFDAVYGTRRLPVRVDQVGGPAMVPRPPPLPSQVRKGYREAWDLGIRYVVLHRANCGWLHDGTGDLVYAALRNLARQRFGPPIREDGEAAVFRLPPPST